MMVRSFTVMS